MSIEKAYLDFDIADKSRLIKSFDNLIFEIKKDLIVAYFIQI